MPTSLALCNLRIHKKGLSVVKLKFCILYIDYKNQNYLHNYQLKQFREITMMLVNKVKSQSIYHASTLNINVWLSVTFPI